jgi:hypothetical protein
MTCFSIGRSELLPAAEAPLRLISTGLSRVATRA